MATNGTIDRRGLTIGVVVGVPAAVGVAAVLAAFRSLFDATNAALVLMIVVVGVAALGGRAAGVVTALAAVASFDFFHTQPYRSLAIDSRDDVETTVLLLIAGLLVGTIASARRLSRLAPEPPATRSAASTASPSAPCPAPRRPTSSPSPRTS